MWPLRQVSPKELWKAQTSPKRETSWSLESPHGVCYLKGQFSSWSVQTLPFLSKEKVLFPLHLALRMCNNQIFPHPPRRLLEGKFLNACLRSKTPPVLWMKYFSHHFSAHLLFAARRLKSPVVFGNNPWRNGSKRKSAIVAPSRFFYDLSSAWTPDRKPTSCSLPCSQSIIDDLPGAQVEKRGPLYTFWQICRPGILFEQL